MFDLTLAILHHVIVFGLVAILFAELVVVRTGMDLAAVARVAAIDRWYGAAAGLIVILGFARAILAAKGWYYYAHNAFFWAKIGAFVLIALLSIPPTIAYFRWRKAASGPTPEAIGRVRQFLWIELVLLAPLLGFAAAMARGYGTF